MLLRAAALCLALTGASAWWRDEDTRTRGEAPPVSMLPGYRVACVGSTAYLWGADLS